MICRAGASPAIDSASEALALQILQICFTSTIDAGARIGSMEMARLGPTSSEEAPSAVHDVQRPFIDVERGFSHSLTQGRVRMGGTPDIFGAAAEFDH
jgi:hypothetical protein